MIGPKPKIITGLVKLFGFLTCLLGGFLSTGFAQTYEQQADSMLNLLEQTEDEQRQVDLLNEISYNYRRVSFENVIKYAKEADRLARQIDYVEGIGTANKNLGIGYYKRGMIKDSALVYYEIALEIAKEIEDYYTEGAVLNNIALVYFADTDYNLAIQYFLRGIRIFDEHFDDGERLKALMLANVGNSYLRLGEKEKSLQYLEKTIAMARRYNHMSILSMYLDNLGDVLMRLDRFDEAELAFEEALMHQNNMGDTQSKLQTYSHLIDLKLKKEEYPLAKKIAIEALEISKEGFPVLYTDALYKLGEISFRENKFVEARTLAKKALEKAREIHDIYTQKRALDILVKSYQYAEKYDSAFIMSMELMTVKDTFNTIENAKYTALIEANFQTREQAKEIEYLNQIRESQEARINLLFTFFFIGILLAVAIFYLLWKRIQSTRIIQQKNAELEKYIEYNLQLENFAYIASHDLKTPLRTIISFTQLLKRKVSEKLSETEKEYLEFIVDGTKEMSYLIDDLLTYSRLETRALQIESHNLEDLLKNTLTQISTYVEEQKAEIQLQLKTINIKGDKIKLQQLFQNLILNGIKFHQLGKTPQIKIQCKEEEKHWLFEFKDNGIGIEKQYFDKIFLIFKRLNRKDEYEGSGIGLAICKKIVEKHGGQMWVESEINKGSSFFFTLPKSIPELENRL